jgi:hypothetical protein
VVVETVDADGSARETTVWLVVVDGEGYVRTSGGSRWGDNAVRRGALSLRVAGAAYPMQVEPVEDDALRERVADAFRAKYGWTDAVLSWMRSARPRIFHLVPSPPE